MTSLFAVIVDVDTGIVFEYFMSRARLPSVLRSVCVSGAVQRSMRSIVSGPNSAPHAHADLKTLGSLALGKEEIEDSFGV